MQNVLCEHSVLALQKESLLKRLQGLTTENAVLKDQVGCTDVFLLRFIERSIMSVQHQTTKDDALKHKTAYNVGQCHGF